MIFGGFAWKPAILRQGDSPYSLISQGSELNVKKNIISFDFLRKVSLISQHPQDTAAVRKSAAIFKSPY